MSCLGHSRGKESGTKQWKKCKRHENQQMMNSEETEAGELCEEGKGEGEQGSVTAGKGHNATVVYPHGEGFSVPSGSEREVSMA
jgi:hypothetical protein